MRKVRALSLFPRPATNRDEPIAQMRRAEWAATWASSAVRSSCMFLIALTSAAFTLSSDLHTSLTFESVGRIVGTGIFSVPASILGSVGSVGASLMLWILGSFLSFCGLFIWLELGTMFPRSGGEKVYLEAVYRRPKHLATVVFAINAIILTNSANGCIVRDESTLLICCYSLC